MPNPDPKALQVTRAVQLAEQPELTILFGSRARGDHEEPDSDIDIMLLDDQTPEEDYKRLATEKAEAYARKLYGRDVFVQLVWRTTKEFRHSRRYINSIETKAVREGTIISKDPESYYAQDYEDEETESLVSWTVYDERLRHADAHLITFNSNCEHSMPDLTIGQQAQNALEHSMKALLEAIPNAKYRNVHGIHLLLGNIRHFDPELQEFRLSIPPDVYSQYAGDQNYSPGTHPDLTDFPDFQQRTVQDMEFILERAKELRARKEQE